MLQVENEKVYIEHCQGCSTHGWCTKHDESKYQSYFENCKAKILVICPEVQVVANQIPIAFSNKFTYSDDSKPWEGKHSFPRIGAFEIYFKDKIIFSKLETGLWPQSTIIAKKIRELLDQIKLPPRPKDLHNTNILRKRKKSKPKSRNIKSIEPNSSRNLSNRGKSSTPRRKLNEVEAYVTDTSVYNNKYRDHKQKVNDTTNKEEEYSDDFKEASNEWEKDFEEKGLTEQREVSKVYELVLPANALSNKVRDI